MTNLRRPWRSPWWAGRLLAAAAIVASLGAAGAIALASGLPPPNLTAEGTPLPVASPPRATAPPATPAPQTVAPATGLTSATTLTSVGNSELVALTSTAAALSEQGGAWIPIPVPPGTSGLTIDHANPSILAAGGASVRMTSDGGRHWAATAAQPGPGGPFVPLLISPWDSRVLFVSANGHLAVTTDGGGTWHDVGVPPGGRPVMASGNASGTFFVLLGGNVYQLTGNGGQITKRPPLPSGATATSLAVGQSLLVACCANRHLLVLSGTKWTVTSIATAGPMAVDGSDIWAALPPSSPSVPPMVEESGDAGATWQARPGLPAGLVVLSLTLSPDPQTVYALTSGGQVYEAQRGVWYLLSTGLQLASPPP